MLAAAIMAFSSAAAEDAAAGERLGEAAAMSEETVEYEMGGVLLIV